MLRRFRSLPLLRRPFRAAAFCVALLALVPGPARAQDGSAGAAIVGGITGGVGALWAFHGLSGCPVATVGAARAADACDTGSLVAALGGTGAGIWVGARDAGAGYGMGVGGTVALGLTLLLDQVADPPRWLNSALILTGVVAGGFLGGSS